MTYNEMFEIFMKNNVDHLQVTNEDGFIFLELLKNKNALCHFQIIINNEKGQTLIKKIK